jgi:cytochrome P450
VRVAPNELSTLAPGAWQDLYASKPLLPKEPRHQTPPLNGGNSLFTADGADHKRIRGTLIHAFSDKALREQAPLLDQHVANFIARVRRELAANKKGGVLDLQFLYGLAVFDMATDLSYGESINGLEGLTAHPWIARFFLHTTYHTIRNLMQWYWPLDAILDAIFLRLTRESRHRNWKVTVEKIDRRLAKGDLTGIRSDLITPVIGRVNEDGSKGISKKELVTHSLATVIANCQIATNAITTCTYLMLKYPDTYKELLHEIRSTFNSEAEITVQSTQGLKYMEACLNEAIRMHHPTPGSMPRVLPAEGKVVDGKFIPGNVSWGARFLLFHRR